MQIVTFPPALIEAYLDDVRELLETGKVAEGRYFRDLGETYVPDRLSIPVSSGGAAIFSLLAYHRYVGGRSRAIVQSNTMRALYTVPTLLGMPVQVVACSYADFLSMNPDALEQALREPGARENAVVVYSVIGGYLAPSFTRIVELCKSYAVPLVVDGAHAHYLAAVAREPSLDVAYSFYATKILPAGEGGLIATSDHERHAWLRRFLMYDRFSNQLAVGLNLRASELTGALIHRLMTDASLNRHFRDERVAIANEYRAVCEARSVRYLDPRAAADYNGYKLVVLEPFESVRALGTMLTEHAKTSAVFDTDVLGAPTALPHWCPPTYTSLRASPAP